MTGRKKAASRNELRRAAEARLSSRTVKRRPQTEAEWRRLQHKLEVHRIELEMQSEELRTAKAEIENQLALFANLYDFAPVGYFNLSDDSTIHLVNFAGAKLVGVDRSKLIGRRLQLYIPETDRPAFNTFLAQIFATRARQTVEIRLVQNNQKPLNIHLEAAMSPDGKSCRLMVQDISHRKRIEATLQESNTLLSLFMQHSPIFAYIKEVTPDASRVLLASDNFREMVGIPGSAMRGKTMAELFPSELAAKITRDDQAVLAKGKEFKIDEELNGRHYSSVKFPIIQGGRSLLAGYTIDITERRRAEVEREQFFKLFNISTDLMVFADPQGCFQRVNPATLRLLGYSEAELLEKPFLSFVHPDDRQTTSDEMARQMQTGNTMNFINRYLCKDSSVRWLSWHASYVAADGTTYATARDITQQQQAAQELKNLEAQYHDLYENAPDMYLSTDSATGCVIRCNQTFLNATGYTRDEIIGQPVFALYQPESQPEARQALKRFISTGRLLNLELILKRKDGSALPISLNSSAVRDPQGRILHSRSTLHDITERKQAAEALHQSEERFRAIANFSPDIISIFDREGRLIFNSAAAVKIHGYPASELENRSTFDFIHPEDRSGVADVFSRLLKDKAGEVKVQYRYRNANGSYKWMEALGRNELSNPLIKGIIAISRDISERKLAEDKLRKSAQFIAETGKIGKVGGWEFDIHSGKQIWTEAVYDIHEVEPGYKPTLKKGIKFYTPASRRVIERAVKGAIEQGKVFDVELDIITAKGNLRWVKAVGKPDPERRRIFGFFQDITERKRAEMELRQLNEKLELRVFERTAALQESEERFRAIASYTRDFIFIQDLDLRYRLLINPLLGFTVADLQDKTDWEVFNENDARRLTAIKKKVYASGQPVHVELSLPNLLGEIEILEGDYIPKQNATGKVDGLIGYFRNITERVRLEQEILNISERERRSITRDLHDGLGQLLVGANYLTSTLRKDLAAKPGPIVRQLDRIQAVITEAIMQTRNLSHGVQPVEPEPNGLTVALEKLAEQTRNLFRVRCEFKCLPSVVIEDNIVATHLFRIAQEAVTNAIKHGRPKRILIRLTRPLGRIKLVVVDDGLGISTRRRRQAGMGLNSMRYRAGIIGGKLTIQKKSAGGTAVACSVSISGPKYRPATGKKD